MKVENNSGLRPLGRAVLVKTYEPERKNSLIVLAPTAEERAQSLETRAVVLEVGPACWPDEPPRAKPGDKVFVSRMAGFLARGTLDGELYRFVNDRDIFAKIEGEA